MKSITFIIALFVSALVNAQTTFDVDLNVNDARGNLVISQPTAFLFPELVVDDSVVVGDGCTTQTNAASSNELCRTTAGTATEAVINVATSPLTTLNLSLVGSTANGFSLLPVFDTNSTVNLNNQVIPLTGSIERNIDATVIVDDLTAVTAGPVVLQYTVTATFL
ncbi:hypothetical protein [Agarilytica rhodophyticola]|uniref:hypothetical protein n=1 Tax=Agarilytica rhodophyticola TaxID=1737490 RepID=UPI000B347EC3|nr:hypothetical protein [Agarilytica rhodophyticola]